MLFMLMVMTVFFVVTGLIGLAVSLGFLFFYWVMPYIFKSLVAATLMYLIYRFIKDIEKKDDYPEY